QTLGCIEGVTFQPELAQTKSNRWLTALTIDPEITGTTPRAIIDSLALHNVEARPVWKPMHMQPLFKDVEYYPHEKGSSNSDKLFANGLCLPSGSNMTESDQEKVIAIVYDCLMEKSSVR